jgi:hypothetical protein
MSVFDTDDFFTHGASYVEETFIGCGGEFCPGPLVEGFPPDPTDPPVCSKCRAGTVTTVQVLRPYGMQEG